MPRLEKLRKIRVKSMMRKAGQWNLTFAAIFASSSNVSKKSPIRKRRIVSGCFAFTC
jgi:hypothetical protein